MSLINVAPWQAAMESQLDALRLVTLFLNDAPRGIRDLKSWNVDRRLLTTASPFAWSDEVAQAVIRAGESIPLDTPLSQWNLETEAAWWRFEKPLPFQTIVDSSVGVRALCFGWAPTAKRDFGLPVCVWTDTGPETSKHWQGSVLPSQTFEWERGVTLGEMLIRTRAHHAKRYGPGGVDEHVGQIPVEAFMATTEALARFLLAGLAWLNQKVLVTEWAHVERHRRKEYAKKVGREVTLRVVQLRRAQSQVRVGIEGEAVEWSCRWVVNGHWRNQAYGTKHSDRRLKWIPAYVKGPDDKPLKAQAAKVYEVSR